ncbi:MAG: V-type ATPase subunit [Thermoplasmata archaeon]|nr:V-type ATPase subunit [Thermoplasmata archaeon]MCI4337709.1 V-type ATPase subunit [Thermoplasmata archaeon]MCI4341609.1 V-type ATPase subunit [Thermoplasmata archaeon]
MAGSPYASALGRFKALAPTLLPKEAYAPLVQARDTKELLKLLEPTAYGPEFVQAGATYQGPALIEVAINRLFVHRNRMVYEAAPYAGKMLIEAYLRRWDIENIGLVLAAKAQGRSLSETEAFLVSNREVPAGLFAGPMTLDDFRTLLQQPSLEAIASQLVRFGYGGTLLPLLETYARDRDIFPLLQALDRDYYRRLFEHGGFFQGDEWVIREYLRTEVDVRNVLLLLKGKHSDLPVEAVLGRFLDGGNLPRNRAADLYNARGVLELANQLLPAYPSLAEGIAEYPREHSLVPFEIALTRDRAVSQLRRLRSFPLSISILFGFLLLSELERADLRRIAYGKLYGVPAEELTRSLVVPRL